MAIPDNFNRGFTAYVPKALNQTLAWPFTGCAAFTGLGAGQRAFYSCHAAALAARQRAQWWIPRRRTGAAARSGFFSPLFVQVEVSELDPHGTTAMPGNYRRAAMTLYTTYGEAENLLREALYGTGNSRVLQVGVFEDDGCMTMSICKVVLGALVKAARRTESTGRIQEMLT